MDGFTTSLGKRVEFAPIGPLLDKLHSSLPEVKVPTYIVPTALGVNEEWPLIEKTPTTAEEWQAAIERQDSGESQAALRAYKAALDARQATYNKNLMRLILSRGLKVDLPDDDTWIADHKFLGLTVPDDPRERHVHYIETEVLATVEDYRQIMVGVFKTSEVSEELVSQFEAAFQRPLEGRGRAAAEGAKA